MLSIPPVDRGSPPGTRFLENLAYLVPSYQGYKNRDTRREEDSRLRGRILVKLRTLELLLESSSARDGA